MHTCRCYDETMSMGKLTNYVFIFVYASEYVYTGTPEYVHEYECSCMSINYVHIMRLYLLYGHVQHCEETITQKPLCQITQCKLDLSNKLMQSLKQKIFLY